MLLRLLINVNRNAAFWRKGKEIAKYLPTAAWKCPEAIGLLRILKGYWKAAGKCPNTCWQPLVEKAKFSQQLLVKTRQFWFIFSEALLFCVYS
jgi:hypothetical protein